MSFSYFRYPYLTSLTNKAAWRTNKRLVNVWVVACFLRSSMFQKTFLKIQNSLYFCLMLFLYSPLSAIRDTLHASRDTASAKCAAIHNQNPKKIKKFSDSLTPYFTMTYPLFLYAVRCPLYAVFRPNAQLRPFIERDTFLSPFGIQNFYSLIQSSVFWVIFYGFSAFIVRPFFDNWMCLCGICLRLACPELVEGRSLKFEK